MLQQAASISNGIYLNVDESNMLQSLLVCHPADLVVRWTIDSAMIVCVPARSLLPRIFATDW